MLNDNKFQRYSKSRTNALHDTFEGFTRYNYRFVQQQQQRVTRNFTVEVNWNNTIAGEILSNLRIRILRPSFMETFHSVDLPFALRRTTYEKHQREILGGVSKRYAVFYRIAVESRRRGRNVDFSRRARYSQMLLSRCIQNGERIVTELYCRA